MSWFHNLSFRWKLLGALGLILAALVLQSVLVYRAIGAVAAVDRRAVHDLGEDGAAELAYIDLVKMKNG